MKFTLYAGLAGLLALPTVLAAQVQVANDGVSAAFVVPDRYIVKFKPNVDSARRQKYADNINRRKGKKKGLLKSIRIDGFDAAVVEISDSERQTLLDSDLIESAEKDQIVKVNAVATPIEKRTGTSYVSQPDAPWGLARISHASGGASNYYYHQSAGAGVRVYVIDTGIRTTHSDFGGRAVWGKNFIAGSPNTDEFGHGTHVAGTVAGTKYGVAKRATVVAVKVLDKNGMGSFAGILDGIEWAVNDAKARGVAKKSVINLSLGGGYSRAVNNAIKAASDAGLTVVVAAGNDNMDAGLYSPASAPSAITVGAIEGAKGRAYFSNYGLLVDIFAPGVSILSAYHTSDTASYYMDGTSMAAPHVAGLAAYFIAKENLSGSTAVTNRIIAASIKNAVRDPVTSKNRLAYNGAQ